MKKKISTLMGILLVFSVIFALNVHPIANAATVLKVNSLISYDSTNTGPATGGGYPNTAVISDDGGTVTWYSAHTNVVSGVSSGVHVYQRNLSTNTNSLVDVDLSGNPAGVESSGSNGGDFGVSSNGRYVAYGSKSTNVVSSPTVPAGNFGHIYLRDIKSGSTTVVDVNSIGVLGNNVSQPIVTGVSDDGRFVAFWSNATNLLSSNNPSTATDYPYIKDMLTGQVINPASPDGTTRANSYASPVVMSCDASKVFFYSNATNLTPQDDGQYNVYSLDLRNGYNLENLTYPANNGVSMGGGSVSCNGRYVAVASTATNLTSDTVTGSIWHYYRLDLFTDTYSLVDKSSTGYISNTLTSDLNANGTVFTVSRAVSDNGRVVFFSQAKGIVSPTALRSTEVYIRDPEANTTALVPVDTSGVEQGTNGIRGTLSISADGKNVLYNSRATNLVPGITTSYGTPGYTVLSKID